jgi:hypothetical protein
MESEEVSALQVCALATVVEVLGVATVDCVEVLVDEVAVFVLEPHAASTKTATTKIAPTTSTRRRGL